MSWLVWLAALLLASSWLLLLSHCCRLLLTRWGCRGTTRRVSRDHSCRVLDCSFCCIIHHHALQEQQRQQPVPAPPPSPSASLSSPPFDSIPDPSVSACVGSASACRPPSPSDCQCAHSPTAVLYSTPWVVVFSPLRPAASRHLLVVPRRHIRHCSELSLQLRRTAEQEDEEDDSEKEAEEEEVREQSKKEQKGGAAGGAGDEEEFKQREEEEEEQREAAAASWTGTRRRCGWLEEEKQLTAAQYADHMLQVGRLLLAQPGLMTDAQAGRSSSSSSSALARAAVSWFQCRRRRRSGCRGLRRRRRSSSEETQRAAVAEAQFASASGSTRFCFHLPPFNSVAHLHLHCLQLPFVSCWSELSFMPGTPWCKEAQQLRTELMMAEHSLYDDHQLLHRQHYD